VKNFVRNTRQQIQAKQKLDAAMNHVRDHKDLYVTGGACLLAGYFGGASRSRKTTVSVDASPTINVHLYPERKES
jgi:hypothetical protein